MYQYIYGVVLAVYILIAALIVFYNLSLAIKGYPPFKIPSPCPQVLFPRGMQGIGRHNFEEDQQFDKEKSISSNY